MRCFGETKFFRQCPRYVISNTNPCFCWEHEGQRHVRAAEIQAFQREWLELEWAPIGAFLTNRRTKSHKNIRRLQELAADDQNVHTPEVQLGVAGAICRLKAWAFESNIEVEKDLPSVIAATVRQTSRLVEEALDHLRHCYQWNDDTVMFNTTYPHLATWVWARVDRPHENRDILRERFFEEVADSVGQCLNGNMARLMNVFAAIDMDMSPQDSLTNAFGLTNEQLQQKVSQAVLSSSSAQEALEKATPLFAEAGLQDADKKAWTDSIVDHFS